MILTPAWLRLGTVAVALTACRREPPPQPSAGSAPDSVTGIVAVTGTSFGKSPVLRSASEMIRVVVDPADTASLYRVAGVEIVAYGTNTAEGFRLSHFRAARVDGAPVVDGILADSSGVLVLRGEGASWILTNPTQALRSLAGSRVWIGGPIPRGPYTYGVIR